MTIICFLHVNDQYIVGKPRYEGNNFKNVLLKNDCVELSHIRHENNNRYKL